MDSGVRKVSSMYRRLNIEDLPQGWTARDPDERDLAALAELRAAVSRAATGSGTPDVATVVSDGVGAGSWTRKQRVVLDETGAVRAWVVVHDRAAGRTLVEVVIDPDLHLDLADVVAEASFRWVEEAALVFARMRDREGTQLDTGSYEGDGRQYRWLQAAGFARARRWLQMSRPVGPEDAAFPELREGVQIRRVRCRPNGLPAAADVQAIHWVLEESFEDHFNAYRESFPEFVNRLLESPGHAWDHWWLATVKDEDGEEFPGGAIVATISPADSSDAYGSYIDYIGVHRDARGRGLAKGLLRTAIADAAGRGRNRVGLEVDDDSPTGADGLYRSLGWETSYVTESWHRDIGR